MFADRYYTTAKIIDELSSRKCYYTGTLNLNRKNFAQLKTLKLSHREQKELPLYSKRCFSHCLAR